MAIGSQYQKLYESGVSTKAIASKFGVSQYKVYYHLNKIGCVKSQREANRKYELDTEFFKNIDSEHKAYFLGFMLADGSTRGNGNEFRLTLHKTDLHILESFKNHLKYSGGIRYDRGYPYLNIASQELVEDLARHGCTSKKAHTLKMPKVKKPLQRHFVRGVFDGDGSIFKRKNRKETAVFNITGHLPFLKQLETIIPVGCNTLTDKRSIEHGTILINKKLDVKIMFDWLYSGSTVFLQRKNVTWRSITGGGLSR